MNDTPEVSVIIPTRNRQPFLRQALRSALEQDYQEFEIVIVDNASTDSTKPFLEELCDSRIRVYEQPSYVSMQANIWFAVQQVRGRFAVVLSDDDMLDPQFLTQGMAILSSRGEHLFFTANYRHIDAESRIIGGRTSLLEGQYDDAGLFIRRNVAGLCATLFPVDAVKNMGFVDNMFFDWTWWNALCLAGWSLYVSSAHLAFYRIHETSMMVRSTEQEYAFAARDMYRFLAERFGWFKELKRSYEDVEARCRYWESRKDPATWRSFFRYGLSHWSRESVKLLVMRCMPLRMVDFARHRLRSGSALRHPL